MDRVQKFLRTLNPRLRERIISIIEAIVRNELGMLDVKPYKGQRGMYRCRTGDIRIIFVRTRTGENVIVDIDFRGNIYKKR